jgi:hypothetical protein
LTPPFNDDDDVGPDARIGLSTDVEDEYLIQKVHISGAKSRITLSLNKAWSRRMNLKNHDHIVLRLSSDWSEITFWKLPDHKVKPKKTPVVIPTDSDVAAMIDEQKQKIK